MASLRLRTEPTVHQIEVILDRVEAALHGVGARVRRGGRGEVRFRMPPPWRTRGGLLRLVSAGEVKVSAGRGEPRRLRYTLSFAALYALAAVATLGVGVAQWADRLAMLRTVLLLLGAVLLLRMLVHRRMRRMLASSAHEIVERRADEP